MQFAPTSHGRPAAPSFTHFWPMATLNTLRIAGADGVELGIAVSRTVYPRRQVPWRPGAVILAPVESLEHAFAAAPLVHFPLNAPLLLTPARSLDRRVAAEILRLSPTGRGHDDAELPAQVWLAGPLSPDVERDATSLGFRTQRIGDPDPVRTATAVAEARRRVERRPLRDLMLISLDRPADGLATPAFAAHFGTPLLYVRRDSIPIETATYIREAGDAHLYLVGSEAAISREVESQLSTLTLGRTFRIGGRDPYEVAVNFAAFKSPVSDFGWGRRQAMPGQAFTFTAVDDLPAAVVGVPLSHLGKHAPVLVVSGTPPVPGSVSAYLDRLRPPDSAEHPPFMSGYVLGDFRRISPDVQIDIEERLSPLTPHAG